MERQKKLAALRKKVEELLRQALHPEVIDLEDDGGISGFIVSAQFRGMPVIERQILVETALRQSEGKLTKGELRHVFVIAPLSPAEYRAINANNS